MDRLHRRRVTGLMATVLLVATACASATPAAPTAAPKPTAASAPTTAAAPATKPAAQGPAKKVTYALTTQTVGPAQSNYSSLPKALGYWPEENLDVSVITVQGSSLGAQALIAGQSDVAAMGFSSLIEANNQGRDLVGFYTIITKQFQPPAVPCDSPIKSPKDFGGKTVAVSSLESGTIPLVKAMAKADGVDPESMTFVASGVGQEAIQNMKLGRIQIWSYGDDRYAEFELAGECVRLVTNEYFDKIGFQVGLVSTRKWFNENKEMACGIARGIARATDFAMKDPVRATRLHWDVYPESKPAGGDADIDKAVAPLKARLANETPVDGRWGWSTDEHVLSHVDYINTVSAKDYKRDVKLYYDDSCIAYANR